MHAGCTILVVEDDDGIRNSIATLLAEEKVHVFEARNGIEALAVLRNFRIDLAFIDLMMPVMNGWQLVEAMKQDSALAEIPYCILSAVADRAPASAACVLAKPLKIERLIDVVEAHC